MRQSPGVRWRLYSILAAVIGGAYAPSGSSNEPVLQQSAATRSGFERTLSIKNDLSPALRDIRPGPANLVEDYEVPEFGFDDEAMFQVNNDPVVQRWNGRRGLNMPEPDLTFEGLSNFDNFRIRGAHPTPPDTNGDIGPDHYVQTVNTLLAVFDRSGTPLLKDFLPINALWIGFGGDCEIRNSGDPIVLYDLLADRWFISQLDGSTSPYHQCIAVSATGDPTGEWHRYDFIVSTTSFNDYPKFGVWPDGYYMSAGARGSRGQVWAFEREKMLAGLPAQMITFFPSSRLGYLGIMPADLDGPPPPSGAPNYFVGVKQGGPQAIDLFRFHVDWEIPENSTFGLDGEPDSTLEVAPFTVICPGTRSCIPQPDTTVRIDALAGRLVLYRAQYRNFGTHESIVFNHTVDAGGQQAGVRWYEIRDPGNKPLIYQQSTYAPDDGYHRWMGSAAMDGSGNFVIGYSFASSTFYPSIYYAGRLAKDPLGELSQGEALLQFGTGSQTSSGNRWGDYSMLGVDPTDDCTFWYTSEYLEFTSTADWQTRIGKFKFNECVPAAAGSLEGTVTDVATGAPIAAATIQVGAYSRRTDRSGRYSIPRLPVGAYGLAAYSEGYQTLEGGRLEVAAGVAATANLSLNHLQ